MGGALGLTRRDGRRALSALVAFDQLFELFHEIFFPAGSYLFDPTTDRLVQLFPFQFWEETALVVGAVIIVIALDRRGVAARRGPPTRPVPLRRRLSAVSEPGRERPTR